jgi:hypothetical protein
MKTRGEKNPRASDPPARHGQNRQKPDPENQNQISKSHHPIGKSDENERVVRRKTNVA